MNKPKVSDSVITNDNGEFIIPKVGSSEHSLHVNGVGIAPGIFRSPDSGASFEFKTLRCRHCVMFASARPEPVARFGKVWIEDRREYLMQIFEELDSWIRRRLRAVIVNWLPAHARLGVSSAG